MKNFMVLAAAGWLALGMTTVVSAEGKLKMENIQAAYGRFGPERKPLEIYPFDNFIVRFTVSGLKVNSEGKAVTTLKMQFTDAQGSSIVENTFSFNGVLGLGGDTIPGFVSLAMGERVPEGKNILKVTITDNLSKKSISFERQIIGKKPGLQIVALEFFHDADGKLPTSTNLTPGEPLYIRLRAIGFDRTQGKIHTQLTVQTLDADGKENLPKPLLIDLRQEDSKVVEQTEFVNIGGALLANRVGKFTLRLTVTDRTGDQSTKVEVPLVVTAP
jgi:hypothetical protein